MAVFHDNEGHEWLAEKAGRTSGIISPKHEDRSALTPHDIIRFSCTIDGRETVRETTLQAGTLDDLSGEELLKLMNQARTVS